MTIRVPLSLNGVPNSGLFNVDALWVDVRDLIRKRRVAVQTLNQHPSTSMYALSFRTSANGWLCRAHNTKSPFHAASLANRSGEPRHRRRLHMRRERADQRRVHAACAPRRSSLIRSFSAIDAIFGQSRRNTKAKQAMRVDFKECAAHGAHVLVLRHAQEPGVRYMIHVLSFVGRSRLQVNLVKLVEAPTLQFDRDGRSACTGRRSE